jgi:RimJ/RimL family protein N-acetyltransferase
MNSPALLLVPFRGSEDSPSFAALLSAAYLGDEDQPRALLEQTRVFLETNPRPDPWGSYIAYQFDQPLGVCGFMSAPDEVGAVEIAYGIFPAYEGRGYAKRLVSMLVDLAARSGATRVFAHTLAEPNPSNSALKSQGFEFSGEVMHPEDGLVWRWDRAI